MKKILSVVILIICLCTSNCVFATIVPAGTSIFITVKEKNTSKQVISGGTIDAIIDEDVKINGKIVFEKGGKAKINVLSVKKAGFLGIPGEMILYGGEIFDKNNKMHKFTFNKQIVGEEKTWPKVCVACGIFIILAPIALLGFVKGGQAEINPIPPIEVKLESEFSL